MRSLHLPPEKAQHRKMPYAIRREKGKYIVYNRETHRVFGTHSSREKALAQLAALHMHTRHEHRHKHGSGYAHAHIRPHH
jgi:hypothetical protein